MARRCVGAQPIRPPVGNFALAIGKIFCYVFQLVGGTKSITREEMRAFKKVWAEFANPRTGYLEKHRLVPFLAVRLIWNVYCLPLADTFF